MPEKQGTKTLEVTFLLLFDFDNHVILLQFFANFLHGKGVKEGFDQCFSGLFVTTKRLLCRHGKRLKERLKFSCVVAFLFPASCGQSQGH